VREHLVGCSRDRRLGTRVNSRHVILGVGSAAAAWPLAALAQQQSIPVIGFLSGRSPGESASAIGAFRQGLADVGYFEGKNVTIEYHWAEGKYDRLPAIAAELATHHVAVMQRGVIQ
jgi:ABC-type uncharacterized transport system substrate-binding protein